MAEQRLDRIVSQWAGPLSRNLPVAKNVEKNPLCILREHGTFIRSRTTAMNSDQEQVLFKSDERAPDYQVNIEYLGRLEIAVSGRVTGTLYRFSPILPMQLVDPRDAFYLLASGLFGVAS
jgi:hypothetical protein